MSFRVKTTHKSLKPDVPAKPDVSSAMSFFSPDDKVSFLSATSSVPKKEAVPSKSSDGGIAVRSVNAAQEDHM